MPADDRNAKVAFQRDVAQLQTDIQETQRKMSDMNNKLKHMKEAVKLAEMPLGAITTAMSDLERKLKDVNVKMYGDPLKRRLDQDQPVTATQRVGAILYEQKYSTAAPTKTHMDSFAIAKSEFTSVKNSVDQMYAVDIKEIEEMLKNAGAPYTPGRLTPDQKN